MTGESFIETGVDKLVKLVESKKKISTNEAAKALGVSNAVIDEWSDFLEEEGIISIEYKLATTYLVERKLSKKEVVKKAKEFHGTKDAFVRKIETTIQGIDRDTSGLDSLKEEFTKLKDDIGDDLGNVKEELKELENYERLKKGIDKQMYDQQKEFRNKVNDMEKEIFKERRKYKELIDDIEVEKIKLEEEKSEVLTLKQKELKLFKKLEEFKSEVANIKESILQEEEKIDLTEDHIEYFQKIADKIRERIIKENEKLNPLIEESKKQEKKIISLQDDVLKKVVLGRKNIKGHMDDSEKIAEKFKVFLKQKSNIESLLDKVDKEKESLSEELVALIKKAHAFDLVSKKSDVKKYMTELNKKFKDIEKKRNNFKTELGRLVGLIKKSF